MEYTGSRSRGSECGVTGCGGNNMGVTGFVSEIRCVEDLSHFDKLLRVIHNGLQGF